MELVAVGEIEGLGLDDGQHVGEKSGQIIAQAQPPGSRSKRENCQGRRASSGAALAPGSPGNPWEASWGRIC